MRVISQRFTAGGAFGAALFLIGNIAAVVSCIVLASATAYGSLPLAVAGIGAATSLCGIPLMLVGRTYQVGRQGKVQSNVHTEDWNDYR